MCSPLLLLTMNFLCRVVDRPTFSFGGLVAGVSSSYSAGELAQAVSQSFCSILLGSALLVGSSLNS